MSMWELDTASFFIGFAVILAFSITMLVMEFHGDTDQINVRALGDRLCADKGLEYDHRELIDLNPNNEKNHEDGTIPKIYCKSPVKERSLIDGIVVQKDAAAVTSGVDDLHDVATAFIVTRRN